MLRLAQRCLPLLIAGTLPACSTEAPGVARAGHVHELASAGVERVFAARLSIPAGYRRCSTYIPTDGTILRADCGAAAAPSVGVLDVAARASAAVAGAMDAEALHAAALVDLLWDADGGTMRRSISGLRTASRLADRPGAVLADLAAAHLVRAEQTQEPRDLLEALEAAERALEAEPRHPAALFNRALAVDRLGLRGQAAQAWKSFLTVDSVSGWADEARERISHLAAAPEAPYTGGAPQEARLEGWDRLLPDWGAAVLRGDSAAAADRLRSAGLLGEVLEEQGGDATLSDAVRGIRAASARPAAIRALARAHRTYGAGRTAYLALDFAEAGRLFGEVASTAPASPALQAWTRVFRAGTLVYHGRFDESERLLRELAVGTDGARHPALAGSVQWTLATAQLRAGRYEGALHAALEAVSLFESAGEREHLGGVQYLVADVELALGAANRGYGSMHRALATLAPLPGSVWLYNALAVWARAVAGDGLPRAALRMQDESVAVARGRGHPVHAAEAHLSRAELRIGAGDSAGAAADVRAGAEFVARLPAGNIRDWLEADLRLARAAVVVGADPAVAAAVLDSVVAGSEGSRTALRRLRALVRRADARLAFGNVSGAAADLDRATALLAEQRAEIASAPLRSSLLDAARGVFDRMVMLAVAADDPAAALSYLERGRTSLTASGNARVRPGRERPGVPRGSVAVEYALVGDTLLIWSVAETSVRLARATVNRDELARRIERVRSALELRSNESAVHSDLATLHDWLIRPVRDRLGPPGTRLVVIAHGELAGVPFAALRASERDRYLIQEHPLRFAGSLQEVAAGRRGRSVPPAAALFVAGPELAPRDHAGLQRLDGAAAEVESIAALYPGHTVLRGRSADRTALEAALPGAGVIHFAGHSVFDDERPERSYLLLAPDGGKNVSGRLSAAEIEAMDLRHVRLVVLSACETLRSASSSGGGFTALAGSVLAAGAAGVVGSVWRVDDELTRTLMVEFHRAYRDSGDGADALRAAQLRLLRSPDPALRSPVAWAGFRYAGR